MYAFLSLLCWVVTNFPEIIVIVVFFAYYSTGRLIQIVGENVAIGIIKSLFPVCIVVSFILSVIMTVFVWRHYEETVSRGQRRWISNLKFFQNRVGFTIATLIESLLFNFFLLFAIAGLIVCYIKH